MAGGPLLSDARSATMKEEKRDESMDVVESAAEVSSEDPSASTDVISQLESDLGLTLQIMSSSIHFLSNRSAHVQLNDAIPLFQPIGSASAAASKHLIDVEQMYENIEELTDDLVGKAKDMEKLVQSLPRQRDEEVVKRELSELNKAMVQANAEYRDALSQAKTLKTELDNLLRHLCNDHQAVRAQLSAAATSGAASTNRASSIKNSQS